MNAIVRLAYTNDNAARGASSAPELVMGLGPNQLDWLRRHIDSFKYAEDQRWQTQQDTVRAARMAGLI